MNPQVHRLERSSSGEWLDPLGKGQLARWASERRGRVLGCARIVEPDTAGTIQRE